MDVADIIADRNPWWRDGSFRPSQAALPARDLLPELVRRLSDPSGDRSTALLGPRQVGKSTLLMQAAAALLNAGLPAGNLLYADFSDDRLASHTTARDVTAAGRSGLREDAPRILLLDEIHLAPRWERWLKQAVDAERTRAPQLRSRYLVTGSSASLLRAGGRESGFGRWDDVVLEGLSLSEFFRLSGGTHALPPEQALVMRPELGERFLRLGGFPALVNLASVEDARAVLRERVAESAIYKDLLARNIDVGRARLLFNHLVSGSGKIWNAVQRASDLGVDRRTLETWLDALIDTRLVVALSRHDASRKAKHQLGAHPKIYAVDHGLVLAFSSLPSPSEDPDTRGALVETLVFTALRPFARGAEMSYFRNRDGAELDFVIATAREVIGIEVTSAQKLRREKIESVRRAGELVKATRLIVVHDGHTPDEAAGVPNVPLMTFLLDPGRWLS